VERTSEGGSLEDSRRRRGGWPPEGRMEVGGILAAPPGRPPCRCLCSRERNREAACVEYSGEREIEGQGIWL
jgi:hypothetical protein